MAAPTRIHHEQRTARDDCSCWPSLRPGSAAGLRGPGDFVYRVAAIEREFCHFVRQKALECQIQMACAGARRGGREIAVVQHVTETEAVKEIEANLAKSPRRGAKAEAEAGADAVADEESEDGDDGDVSADEAA